jgi:branched-chain amino acid transport system substrate-binding protein
MMRSKSRLIAALLVCLPLFSGQVIAADEPALKVGAIFSVTGRASALGSPEKNTVLLIADQVNRSGGINGYPLELVIVDDESLETAAVAAAEKLINEDRVLAIIGPSLSGNTLKMKPVSQAAKVPLVSCAAAEAIVSPPAESRYSFKTPQRDSDVVRRIMEHIAQAGLKKIAILSEKSPFGEQGAKHLKAIAPEYGVEIVAEDTFAVNSTDMSDQLSRATARGAQAIVNWSVVPVQTVVPKSMHKLGIKLPLYFSHAFGNPKFVNSCEGACEGVIFPIGRIFISDELPADHFQKSVLAAYKRDYEAKYGAVTAFGGYAYDALWLVINAMKAKQITPSMSLSEARDRIRDGLEQTKGWIGVAGQFTMTPDDHCGLDRHQSLELCTVRDGKIAPLKQ